MLWHFSIIDTPSLLCPQQHQWLFFPSYRSLHNKGTRLFSRARLLSPTSPPSSSLEFPPVHVRSSQQHRNSADTSGSVAAAVLWEQGSEQRERVPAPRAARCSAGRITAGSFCEIVTDHVRGISSTVRGKGTCPRQERPEVPSVTLSFLYIYKYIYI